MRSIPLFAVAAMFAASPVLAQTAPEADSTPATPPAVHHPRHSTHHHTGQKPVDVGPNTPEANGAYQGGGVILQGAPGAPAPTPQATPPGQAPANAVPR